MNDMPDLDPVIHTLGRLRVVTVLHRRQAPVPFSDLQGTLGMTSGNLSTHLQRLEQAGYVAIDKTFEDRTPVTRIHLTPSGAQAYATYQEGLRDYIAPPDPATAPGSTDLIHHWPPGQPPSDDQIRRQRRA